MIEPAGTDHLDEVASLSFSVAFSGDGGGESRSWTWRPPTGEVSGATCWFRLGLAQTTAERACESLFLADVFWLEPRLHVAWAKGGDAALEDLGPDVLDGAEVRRFVLQYPAQSGGYTPGDAHELLVDETGALVAWRYRPHAGPAALTATFEAPIQVGPLRVATLRRVEGASGWREVRAYDVSWTPVGAAVSAAPDRAPVITVTPSGCRLGSARVGWRAPRPSQQPPAGVGPFDQTLLVSDQRGAVAHEWSSTTLDQADAGWLATSGVLGCDFRSIDEASLRNALEGLSAPDRRVAVAALWTWGWGSGTFDARVAVLAASLRRSVSACASSGDCEGVYAALRRVR